jgi:hypothetical protein
MSEVTWPFAFDEAERMVWIDNASKGGEYTCPDCEGRMIPVKGDGTRHHFRHHVDSNCSSKGEGPRHYFAKHTLASILRNQRTLEDEYWSVSIEQNVGDYVVDVKAINHCDDGFVEGVYYYEIKDSHALTNEKRNYLKKSGEVHEVDISKMSDDEVYDAINLTTLFVERYKCDRVEFFGGSLHKHNNKWGVKINDYGEFDREDAKQGDYCVVYIKKSDTIRVVRLGKRILHNQKYSFFEYDENDRTELGHWWWTE